ncbi:MAG: argininosuccinate synthase, partial [Desulfobacteraceae bacterium]|nr:argininosuccinate synthase [Desulfobacteraceae bacterium]
MVDVKKVVLAYSGGLDTSVILKWLIETYKCEVVTFTADLGQEEELDGLDEKAISTGAVKAYIEDLREEFIKDYVFPAFRANAIYEGQYLLGTSIARPLIAKRQIEIADLENADAVSHGATGKGNDQVRFELGYYAKNPEIKIIAPWREWDLTSRTKLMEFCKNYGIEVPQTRKKPFSIDRNMLHISYEGGVLEDPWVQAPDELHIMSVRPEDAPDTPEIVDITFKHGDPVAINDKTLSPAELFKKLNQIAGRNGIGRIDIVENRFVGMKSRGVYETPGGTILHAAHRAIESITVDREVMHLKDSLAPKYAELIYYGYWFSPERLALQDLIDKSQKGVTGTVRLKLYKGNCTVSGRKAPHSLYRPELATFEAEKIYNQKDAEGF